MPDAIEADGEDFSKLARDIGKVPRITSRHAVQAVTRTAHRVRESWQEAARGIAHAPAFPSSITYDVSTKRASVLGQFLGADAPVTVEAEIGPDKNRRQGALGNLLEYGSVNNPPMGLGHGALQRNEDDFEQGINRAVEDALREVGL